MVSNILYGLAHLVNIVLNLATLVLIITSAVSWLNISHYNRYIRAILMMSHTMCRPFYGLTRKIPGPFDFAPMFVLMLIVILQKTIPVYLMSLSLQMK